MLFILTALFNSTRKTALPSLPSTSYTPLKRPCERMVLHLSGVFLLTRPPDADVLSGGLDLRVCRLEIIESRNN